MTAGERLDSILYAQARRQGAAIRSREFARRQAHMTLDPIRSWRDWDFHYAAERRFLPHPFWTGTWTPEARRAYYGLT